MLTAEEGRTAEERIHTDKFLQIIAKIKGLILILIGLSMHVLNGQLSSSIKVMLSGRTFSF